MNVGDEPNGIDVHPLDTFVYVTNSNDGTVSVINTATNAVTTVTVGDDPSSFGLFIQPIRPTSVPTMTEWGMIILAVLLGIGSVYYLRRQRLAV